MAFYKFGFRLPISLFCGLLLTPWVGFATEIGVGLNYLKFDYKEDLTPPAKSTESGVVPLLFVGVKIPAPGLSPNSFIELEGESAVDVTTSYEGTTLTTNAPAYATDTQSFLRVEGTLNFAVLENLYLKAGYGYRYWKRYLTFGSGYKEVYTWSTIPIGALYYTKLGSSFAVGFEALYKVMLAGKIQVIFSETVVGGDDTNLDLGNRPGFRLSVPIDYFVNPRLRLQVKGWYEHSEIGQSNSKYNNTSTGTGVLGYIMEPASKTEQVGVIAALYWMI